MSGSSIHASIHPLPSDIARLTTPSACHPVALPAAVAVVIDAACGLRHCLGVFSALYRAPCVLPSPRADAPMRTISEDEVYVCIIM